MTGSTRGASFLQKAGAVLMALALCLGLMPALPALAWGSEDGTANQVAGTATLTIVQGVSSYSGAKTLVNKTYRFKSGATLADLFAAAKAAGDIQDYAFNDSGYGSYLSSVTFGDGTVQANDPGYSSWWSSYKNGEYASGTDAQEGDALANGDAFQFSWCDSYPNIDPTAEQWAGLKGKATEGTGVAVGSGTDSDPTGTATLTIVQGVSSYNGVRALVNKTYRFESGATLADLFAAAKEAGDIQDYAFNDSGYGSYLSSVTFGDGTVQANDPGYSSWWSSYKNGEYASGTDAQEGDALANGDAFQFSWCDSYPNVDPTAEQWAGLKSAATEGTGVAEGEVTPDTSTGGTVEVGDLDTSSQEAYEVLFANLAASCAGSGGTSSNKTESWKALDAAAIGQPSVVDRQAVLADALASYGTSSYTDLARSILVLTALGIDATQVPNGDGAANLVEKLYGLSSAIPYPSWTAFVLLAYASGPYEVPATVACSARNLIGQLALAQGADGSFASGDVDTTAMVVAALAPYQNNDTAKGVLNKATAWLKTAQNADGSFGLTSPVNSTAMAVAALCALGIDPASSPEWTTASGATPMSALLSMAKSDLGGFTVPAGYDQALADEQGFRALAAYQGLKNTGAAYNIYTQAKYGQAGLPETQAASGNGAGNTATSSLAATGDPAAAAAAAAGALALCAAASLGCAARAGRPKPTPAKAKDQVR